MRVANGASNMTTAVALEQNIFRDFLGISGVMTISYEGTIMRVPYNDTA